MAARSLIDRALEARSRAYCPYSHYQVGAAIQFIANGKRMTAIGCNVENLSYGLTNCAERTAVFAAIALHGKIVIERVVVATKDGGTPCGACLQVLLEFAPNDAIVECVDDKRRKRRFRMKQLAPHAFASTEVGPQ